MITTTRRTAVAEEPIEGFVPLPEPDAEPTAPKRTGWPKGKPRGPRPRNALVRLDASDPTLGPPPPPPAPRPGACPVCERVATALTLDMVRELVQAAQDRLEVLGDRGAEVAVSDVRYLSARLEGLCSLACWQRRRQLG
jgi:hypothetical protein